MNCLVCMTEPSVLGRVRTGATLPHNKGTLILAINTVYTLLLPVSYLYRSATLALPSGSILHRMTQSIIITFVVSPLSVVPICILGRNHIFTTMECYAWLVN